MDHPEEPVRGIKSRDHWIRGSTIALMAQFRAEARGEPLEDFEAEPALRLASQAFEPWSSPCWQR